MMLTEEEAKTKWCPMARLTFFKRIPLADRKDSPDVTWKISGTHEFNMIVEEGVGGHTAIGKCIASDCMMWRGHDEPEQRTGETTGNYTAQVHRGYCGLAGKPQ